MVHYLSGKLPGRWRTPTIAAMSRVDWTRWLTAGVAVAAVAIGFLALGEYLPGGDELPYLMLAQNMARHSAFTVSGTFDHAPLHGLTPVELPRLAARESGRKHHSTRPPRPTPPGLSVLSVRQLALTPASLMTRTDETPGLGTRFRWLLGSSARAAWLDRAVGDSTPACRRASAAWSVQASLVRSSPSPFSFQLNRYQAISGGFAAPAMLRRLASPIPLRAAVRGWQVPQRC